MKIRLNLLILVAFSLLTWNASAENGCPPGQLPAQANGAASSCTPIPSYYYQEPPVARPSGRWITTWGAVAMGSKDNVTIYGVTTGKLTRAEAEADALRRCGSRASTECEVTFRYHNQCVAIAEPHIDGLPFDEGRVRFVSAATISEASKVVKEDCAIGNKMDPEVVCKVVYKACTKQIFERF